MSGGPEGRPGLAEARTGWAWRDTETVEDDTIRALYERAAFGPTSGNSQPARFLFLRSPGAKLRLRPALSEGNVRRVMAAPVVAIVASDPAFHRFLPQLGADAATAAVFADNPAFANDTARRNTTLGGAWLIAAARELGLDCGPMSGVRQCDGRRDLPRGLWLAERFSSCASGTRTAVPIRPAHPVCRSMRRVFCCRSREGLPSRWGRRGPAS